MEIVKKMEELVSIFLSIFYRHKQKLTNIDIF